MFTKVKLTCSQAHNSCSHSHSSNVVIYLKQQYKAHFCSWLVKTHNQSNVLYYHYFIPSNINGKISILDICICDCILCKLRFCLLLHSAPLIHVVGFYVLQFYLKIWFFICRLKFDVFIYELKNAPTFLS